MRPVTRLSRQAVTTLVMIFLTILPTVYVGVLAWRVNRPGHIRDVEIEIGRALGLQVTLEDVRYPRPGEVAYRGIVLRQEEPRGAGLVEIARADRIRLGRDGDEVILEAEGLKLRASGPGSAMAQVGALLKKSGLGPIRRINLSAPKCEVDLGGEGDRRLKFVLEDLGASFLDDLAAPSITAGYRLTDSGLSTRCEFVLRRDRKGEDVETNLALRTVEGHPLPGRVLDLFLDARPWLGSKSRIQGDLELRQVNDGDWNAVFSGDLVNVDLENLFKNRFPDHRLTGLANLRVDLARWEEREGQGVGWSEIRGELLSGPGSIGLGLIQALTKEMRFRASARLVTRLSEIEYKRLGFKFGLSAAGELSIEGGIGAEFAPDDILLVNDRPVFKAPSGSANVRGLLKSLFPAGAETMIPSMPEARAFSRFLPMPRDLASRADARLEGN